MHTSLSFPLVGSVLFCVELSEARGGGMEEVPWSLANMGLEAQSVGTGLEAGATKFILVLGFSRACLVRSVKSNIRT